MNPFFFALFVSALLVLPSCSCAIYWKEYRSPGDRKAIREESVAKVAGMHGFGSASSENGQVSYRKKDLLLVHSPRDKKLRLSGSLCPAPWNIHRLGKWESECRSTGEAVVSSFGKLGIPLEEKPSVALSVPTAIQRSSR